MGTWTKIDNTSTHNIPATSGKYFSFPYYIGLLKNGELNTTEAISDLTFTKSVEWIKDAYIDLQTRSPNGDYYPLTYEVDENTETSPRSGIITVTYGPANKSIEYLITLAVKPTLNEYVFLITNYSNNSNNKYSLQVCGKSPDLNPDNKVSFASINNDSTPLNIDIKIALKATAETSGRNLIFNFIIIGDGFEFDSSIDNAGTTGLKSVDIMLGGERKGELKISNIVSGGLDVHITIFSNNLNPKALALLSEDIISENISVISEDITGKIAIKNSTHEIHEIPFVVRFGFS